MSDYRLYFFTAQNHIRQRVEFACDTDEEAIARVQQHRDGSALELWSGARLVASFEQATSEQTAKA